MTLPGTTAAARWRGRGAALIHLGTKQLLVGAGIGVARVAGFLTGALVARTLGPRGFAYYTVAFTILTSLTQLTTFAETWLVSRWDDPAIRSGVRVTVWRIKAGAALLSLGLAGVLLGITPGLVARIGTNGPLLILAVLASGAGALTSAAASVFQAESDFRRYAVTIAASPALGLLLTGLLALRGEARPGAYVMAILVAYLPTAVLARVLLRDRVAAPHASSLMREALHFGGWVTIGSMAYVVFQRLDVFLLAALRPGPEVGIYGAAVRLSMIGAVFGNTLTAVLMPPGSQGSTWKDRTARKTYLTESLLGLGVMAVALGLGVAYSGLLVTVFFGSAYAAAAAPLAILLLAQMVLVMQMPLYFAMYGLRGVRWIAALGVGQLAVAGLSGYLLIRGHGAVGAAWSNVATYALGVVVVACFHAKRRTLWGGEG